MREADRRSGPSIRSPQEPYAAHHILLVAHLALSKVAREAVLAARNRRRREDRGNWHEV